MVLGESINKKMEKCIRNSVNYPVYWAINDSVKYHLNMMLQWNVESTVYNTVKNNTTNETR